MVDLAAALGVTPSTAGRMCDRLLRKGLIRRHRARSDRRALTGDFTLTLPVMLAVAVAVATATSRALSYGTIYTTKLLRRGQDVDRAALPVLSGDGQQVQGWLTGASVLSAVASEVPGTAPPGTGEQAAADAGGPAGERPARPPEPLAGYEVLEIAIFAGSPAAGSALGTVSWPPGCFPVSVLHGRALQDPDPAMILAPGDRISLLIRAAEFPQAGPEPRAQAGPAAIGTAAAPRTPPHLSDGRCPGGAGCSAAVQGRPVQRGLPCRCTPSAAGKETATSRPAGYSARPLLRCSS
ncbi:MAG: MarR family transcriptional regulator [Streptosporangiaceae bacterium]|jgi:hypothetical protein